LTEDLVVATQSAGGGSADLSSSIYIMKPQILLGMLNLIFLCSINICFVWTCYHTSVYLRNSITCS